MAKLGRYSANRIKVESITESKQLEVHDCGTLLLLDAAAGCTVTLPSVAEAGKGWWVRFVISTNVSSNTLVITEKTSEDTDVLVGGINELEVDTSDDGPSTTGATTITIANAADTVGDFVEFVCDGSKFYFHGQTKLDGCMTIA
tara:strand:+ start:1654 stop:2085 length:432 start_codon:yes stop_codon:yes gene_type:complete